MSLFSGKCDLCDHIMMMKTYPKESNPNVLVSDEKECFEIFKARTGGQIYQYIKVPVTRRNIDFLIKASEKRSPGSAWNLKVEEVENPKTGKKQTRYHYMGETYKTLASLNQHGYYYTKTIAFDTLLDIIPYYPYTISMMTSSDGKETVFISTKSFVDFEEEERLEYGYESEMGRYYRKHLQDHYIEVCHRYFNTDGREVVEICPVVDGIATTEHDIDGDWPIEVQRDRHPYVYSAPTKIDDRHCDVSKVWPEEKMDHIMLKYIKRGEQKLYLD